MRDYPTLQVLQQNLGCSNSKGRSKCIGVIRSLNLRSSVISGTVSLRYVKLMPRTVVLNRKKRFNPLQRLQLLNTHLISSKLKHRNSTFIAVLHFSHFSVTVGSTFQSVVLHFSHSRFYISVTVGSTFQPQQVLQ